jgi:hypothetical protein
MSVRDEREREFPEGTRVRAVSWAPSEMIDDNVTVPPGTEGTVRWSDDAGTVFTEWDNGARIGFTTLDRVERV